MLQKWLSRVLCPLVICGCATQVSIQSHSINANGQVLQRIFVIIDDGYFGRIAQPFIPIFESALAGCGIATAFSDVNHPGSETQATKLLNFSPDTIATLQWISSNTMPSLSLNYEVQMQDVTNEDIFWRAEMSLGPNHIRGRLNSQTVVTAFAARLVNQLTVDGVLPEECHI